MDDGSNSKDSYRQKIKVMKIKAVKKLDEKSYSEVSEYWYYRETGIVYDLEQEFPVGRVDKNDDGNEMKLDSNTYIITTLIDIPEFKIYE
jgi:hypothetical protein